MDVNSPREPMTSEEEHQELLPHATMKVQLTKDNEILERDHSTRPGHAATVEEALGYTGFGKYNFGLLLVCSWTLQAMGVVLFGSSFPIAAAVCDLQLTMQQRALLTATPLIGAVVGAHLWGYTADTKGRKLTLLISMSMGFVFGAFNSLAPGWKSMALLLLLSSTFTSASNSAAYTLLGESCDVRVRGRAMLLCTCALMCAQATAAVFAYPILPLEFSYHVPVVDIWFSPWRLLVLVLSLPCAARFQVKYRDFLQSPFIFTDTEATEGSSEQESVFEQEATPKVGRPEKSFEDCSEHTKRLVWDDSLCAVTACALTAFHESPKFLMTRGRHEEALHVLRSIYASNTGRQPDDFPVKKLVVDETEPAPEQHSSFLSALWHQTAPLFTPPLLNKTLHLFYIVIVIYMTGSGFILWLPYIMNSLFSVLETGGAGGMNLCAVIHLSQERLVATVNSTLASSSPAEECDASIQDTALFTAMFYGALASSTNLVLSLTVGSRKRVAMLCILTSSAVAAVLLNVVRVPIAGGIFFLFFLMCALSMGILSVYFVELYPTHLRGMASCLSVMVGRLAAFVGANIIAPLISSSCELTFYLWAAFICSAIAFTWFLPRDRPQKNK